MGMKRFLIRRTIVLIGMIFIWFTIVFFLFRILPGDPISMLIEEDVTVGGQEKLREIWGLDKPLYEQYFLNIKNFLRGDFGISFTATRPVSDLLWDAALNTIFLMGIATLIAFCLGLILGIIIAWRRGSTLDSATIIWALIGRSAPVFWTGELLIMVFAFKLDLFPVGGMHTAGFNPANLIEKYFSFDFLLHLILPLTCSIFYLFGLPMLVTRNAMLKTLGEDYIEMARAKGLKQRVILRHAFRNSILPVFTLFITEIGFILGGMMLIEVTFDWPGMGRLIFYSAASQDYPLAMGSLFIIGMVIILMNYIGDISYGFLDPRLVYD